MKRRTFIKNASILSITILSLLTHQNCSNTNKNNNSEKKPLIDNLWLWGHNAGSHDNKFGIKGTTNLMGPKEACDYLEIKNCIRVAFGNEGPFPPFDNEAKKLIGLKEVVWSAVGDASSTQHDDDESDLDEILRIAVEYDNISGAILDDFFINPTADGKVARHSLESIREMRNKLHEFNKRPLNLWLVWYTHHLNLEVADYIELFDVITFWEWEASNLIHLEGNIREFVKKTPGKRRLFGVYLWNFGEGKPMTIPELEHQLKVCYEHIKAGDIEGIVFCANTVVDIGLESVDYVRNWISQNGSTEI